MHVFFTYLGNLHNHNLSDFFDYIGTFEFENTIGSSKSLGTDGVIYSYEHKEQLSAAPGETIDITVLIRDEFKQRADTPVLVINPRYNSSNLLRDNKTVIVGERKKT